MVIPQNFVILKKQLIHSFRTKELAAEKSGWRDSFLIERGKMTFDRYHKIRNAMPQVTGYYPNLMKYTGKLYS